MFVTNLEIDNFLHPEVYTLASVHAWVYKNTLVIFFPLGDVVRLGSEKNKKRFHQVKS